MNRSSKNQGQGVGAPEWGATTAPVPRVQRRKPAGLPTHLSLPRQVAVIALWPMLEQLMSSLVGFVDTALAGRLALEAREAVNAIGVASFVTWLMGLFQGAVGVGSTALVARAVGGNHRREASAAIGQSILLAIVWGLFIAVFFYFTAPWFGWFFGLSGRSLELCTQYLRVLSIATPLMAVLFIGAACLRGAGDFRSPFAIMVVVNVVNLGVSVALVRAPAPIGGHGLLGVAWGTAVAWSVGCILMIALLLSGRGGARLHPHRLRFHARMLWRLLRVGIPSLIDSVTFWFGHALVLLIIGHMGREDFIGAHSIAIRVEAISFLPGFAFSLAAATMAGQYLGARDVATARRAVWVCWIYASGIMVTLGVLFMTIPRFFVWLLTDEPVFLHLVPPLLFMAGWAQIGFSTSMVLAGAMRGAGDTRMTMFLNTFTTIVVRVPIVWYVAEHTDYGLTGVWFVLSAELILRASLFVARYVEGGWTKIKV